LLVLVEQQMQTGLVVLVERALLWTIRPQSHPNRHDHRSLQQALMHAQTSETADGPVAVALEPLRQVMVCRSYQRSSNLALVAQPIAQVLLVVAYQGLDPLRTQQKGLQTLLRGVRMNRRVMQLFGESCGASGS
jgi:hypothetical protein